MTQLDQIKKISPYIAGIALFIFGIVGLISGESFLGYAIYVSAIVFGVSCMLDNAEIVSVISAAALAAFNLFSLIGSFFSLLSNIIHGYLTALYVISSILALGVAFLKLVSAAALLAFVICSWKNITNQFAKFWYAPAAIALLSALLTLFIPVLNVVLFRYGIGFHFVLNILKTLVMNIIYAVGIAAASLKFYKTESDVIGYIPPVA